MSKRATIVVDLQNDYFPSGRLPLVAIEAVTANAARVIAAVRDNGDLVVHIRHEFNHPEAPFFAPGTKGAQINAAVEPHEGEPVILKHYANAFRETELKQILDEKGVRQIVIVGAMSHMCIDAVTRSAADFGYSAIVIHDACTTHDLEFNGTKVSAEHVHATIMAALASSYAEVRSTKDFIDQRGEL